MPGKSHNFIMIIILLFLFCSTVVGADSDFMVEEGKIIAPDGDEFIVKGTNVSGYNWVWPRSVVDDLELIVDLWNFNAIRVNCNLKRRGDVSTHNDNNDLEELVNKFTERNIVVMFEAHDHTGGYYTENSDPSLQELQDWYYELAVKYKDNPYVWFNVMNEPGDGGEVSEQWLTTHQAVIETIRKEADAGNIIVTDGAAWGQDVGEWNNNPVPEENSAVLTYGPELVEDYENIVFSFHVYDQWKYSQEKMEDYIERVQEKGLALIVGEYGINNNNDTKKAAEILFEVTPRKKVGRIVWHWYGGDENDLTEYGGGYLIKMDNGEPENLSWLGRKVWEDNHTDEE